MTERRLKDPKMKKLIEKKSQKLTKNQKICANFELETHIQALQNTAVSISEVDIPIEHRIKVNSTKNQITSKKGYLYVPFKSKTTFTVQKSFTKRGA